MIISELNINIKMVGDTYEKENNNSIKYLISGYINSYLMQ